VPRQEEPEATDSHDIYFLNFGRVAEAGLEELGRLAMGGGTRDGCAENRKKNKGVHSWVPGPMRGMAGWIIEPEGGG